MTTEISVMYGSKKVKNTEFNKSQVTCRYSIHIIMLSWSDLGITSYQDGCCSRIYYLADFLYVVQEF